MVVTSNAYCQPGAKLSRTVTEFGIYGASGLVPHCEIVTSPWTAIPPQTAPAPMDALRLYGPSLFAGSVDFQFGYVLLNSLGRLYAVDRLTPETTLVFACKPMHGPNPLKATPTILRSLGITNPILIIDRAIYFEELHSTPEIFGELLGACGTKEFYAWIDSRWYRHRIQTGKKIYLTRTGLKPQSGRFACEDHLETLLAAEGYEIISPEKLPLSEQIRLLQSAEKLIFSEGSALHLFSLLRQPGQLSAVIQRRRELPAAMAAQMKDRSGIPTQAINAVNDIFWPPTRGDHLGVSVLDFDKLRTDLMLAGLINGKGWKAPSKDHVERSLVAGLNPGETLMDGAARQIWLAQLRANRGRRIAA